MKVSVSLACILLSVAPLALAATPSASIELLSSRNGEVVGPGDPIDWEVRLELDPEGNEGLALIVFDLVQDPGNPGPIDITAASSVDPEMQPFDRPAGFTNPGQDPVVGAFRGTPVGADGARNLLQIGGAQNTFGHAPRCLGPREQVCMGQRTRVTRGVGHAGVSVARGSFPAPAAPGSYVVSVRNVTAHALRTVAIPPAASVVQEARVDGSTAILAFVVE